MKNESPKNSPRIEELCKKLQETLLRDEKPKRNFSSIQIENNYTIKTCIGEILLNTIEKRNKVIKNRKMKLEFLNLQPK
jgi:hypothetical protein